MKKTIVTLPEKKLVGIKIRTNNALEINSSTSNIQKCVQKYWEENTPNRIKNRVKVGTTFCVYTDYESDFTGEYTFFIGEEVSSFDKIDETLKTHSIPSQKYVRFTAGPGAMPGVVIDAWGKIWKMTKQTMGGERAYISDFEVYDERAADKEKTTIDICIGIK